MKQTLTIIAFFFVCLSLGFGQDTTQNNNWKLYPSGSDSVKLATDTITEIKKAPIKGKVVIKKDPRIDAVSKDLAGGDSKQAKFMGYRIQVVSSPTKATVDTERQRFLQLYPNQRAYIFYKAPNFRLQVGNFRTRLEGEKFQNQIKNVFPNTWIVTEMVDLPILEEPTTED